MLKKTWGGVFFTTPTPHRPFPQLQLRCNPGGEGEGPAHREGEG
jgi:hypothetical protein